MLLRSIVGVAVLLMFSGFVLINSNLVDYTYYLEDSSKLYIEGTSNVNSFDCSCKDNFPKRSIKVAFSDDLKTIRFTNSYFKIRTQSLDCNNSRMNKDLCEALKSSEYPDIKIELKDAKLQSTTPGSDGWLSIKVNASMTITNVTKDIVLDVKGKKTSDEKFRFVCQKEILLTDYNIEPPTALLGLVKVRNNIKINFDLYTVAEQL
ncbi:MAG: YceI family protein [Candidatus Kapabacteria bacterium]|nr:YceI family protein [Candidatus Kapabacteria bacterium]MBX7155194.1 YceI family protein [Bacteroidota bacterium]